jgi:hypothetical protein
MPHAKWHWLVKDAKLMVICGFRASSGEEQTRHQPAEQSVNMS